MPYINEKNRPKIDDEIDKVAEHIANRLDNNILDLAGLYRDHFIDIGNFLNAKVNKRDYYYYRENNNNNNIFNLSSEIWETNKINNYAFLGTLNYAITRLIQIVPKKLVLMKKIKSEFKYFIYALTVDALVSVSGIGLHYGISGVFEDVKDEYKRRVNTSYEAEQIVKSGDCYDAPWFTKLIEIYKDGEFVGYQEIMTKFDFFPPDVKIIGKKEID